MRLTHDISFVEHLETHRCYDILQRNYFWLNMIKNVRRFINNCHTCRKIKYSRNKYNDVLKFLFILERRWVDIFVNFVIELFSIKNDWNILCVNIMIVIDRFNKNLIYEVINDLILEKVVKIFLRTIFSHWKFLYNIIFDRKTQFVNHFWDQLCKKLNIDVKLFIVFHFEIDDQIENVNDVMKQYFRVFCVYFQND